MIFLAKGVIGSPWLSSKLSLTMSMINSAGFSISSLSLPFKKNDLPVSPCLWVILSDALMP
jgi:hypothetical protein